MLFSYLKLVSSFALIFLLLASCGQQSPQKDIHLSKDLHLVDSLIAQGDKQEAREILNTINIQEYKSIPQLITYHLLSATADSSNVHQRLSDATEALSLFDNPDLINHNKALYFKTFVVNGDLNYEAKKYLTALNFYGEAKLLLTDTDCENGYILNKFASIYFDQGNYATAADYFSKSYKLLKSCKTPKDQLKTSYARPEMALNNAGFAFLKANKLDSAAVYYQAFRTQIDQEEAQKNINKQYASLLRKILYDNLGGLNLRLGRLDSARVYVQKSLAIPTDGEDDIHIPPYIKLGQIYTQTGETQKAQTAFRTAKLLLEKHPNQQDTYAPLWLKAYAAYYYKTKQLDSAYNYQKQYIARKNSLELANQQVYTLNISKELTTIAQRQELSQLRHNDQIRRIYVVGLIEFIALVLIIGILIYGNLRKTKKLHQEAIKKNELIGSTINELERSNKNYIRIMRVMAHDLRNPISGMAGLAAALLDDEEELDEESKKMLKLIETIGMHSIEMINELLKTGLAKEDEPIAVKESNLKDLLYDAVELLQFTAKEKKQKIIFENEHPEASALLKVNYEKVWRVINNLLVNAIKFSLSGGVIKTGVKEYKTSFVIYVEDKGVGIPEKDRKAIFEMFTSAKRVGTDGEQSFGLGLSISKKIMEKHKGKIWFENGENGGTTFYLEFPKV